MPLYDDDSGAVHVIVDGLIPVGDFPSPIASDIPFTPAGNLSSTNVQAALVELDTEKQPLDSDLTAVAGLSSTGLIARTGSGTASVRTVTGTSSEITVTNGDGVSGNPTISLPSTIDLTTNGRVLSVLDNTGFSIKDNLDSTKVVQFQVSGVSASTTRTLTVPNASGTIALTSDLSSYQSLDSDLTALASNSTNGLWARTGSGTGSARTITGTTNQITVTNGDGVSGNPTISFPTAFELPADVVHGSYNGTRTSSTAKFRTNAFGTQSAFATYTTSTSARTHFEFENPNGFVGSISTSASATAFNTSSDRRLKKNIRDTDKQDSLNRILRISIKDYEWKADGTTGRGVIADELQEVIPSAVTGEKNSEDMQGVDYSKLVPDLIATVQKLSEQISRLEEKIKELES